MSFDFKIKKLFIPMHSYMLLLTHATLKQRKYFKRAFLFVFVANKSILGNQL